MNTTTNYELKVYEGTDLFNPLTVENYNTDKIDEVLKANADGGITDATELLTSNVHAISRVNGDCPMLRFTATSNYTSGDTFTVDGVQVTALTPTGEALGSGAYIIGSEVLGCLKGTLLTLFLTGGVATVADNALKLGGELPEYYGKASDVASATQTATAAGVLANSCQTQITEINENLTNFNTRIFIDSLSLSPNSQSVSKTLDIDLSKYSKIQMTLSMIGDSDWGNGIEVQSREIYLDGILLRYRYDISFFNSALLKVTEGYFFPSTKKISLLNNLNWDIKLDVFGWLK